MIEGIVGLVELLVAAISALISIVVGLTTALLHSLGFAATKLGTPPEASEQRYSARRLAIAFTPLALLLVTVPAVFWFVYWRVDSNRSKRRETETLVEKAAENLAQTGEDGRFVRQNEFALKDAWGQDVILEYSESDVNETLLVRSIGSDGKQETTDDIVAKRRNVLPIGDVAGAFARRIKDSIAKPAREK